MQGRALQRCARHCTAAHMSWLLLLDPPAPSRAIIASIPARPSPIARTSSPTAPSHGRLGRRPPLHRGPMAAWRACAAPRRFPLARSAPRQPASTLAQPSPSRAAPLLDPALYAIMPAASALQAAPGPQGAGGGGHGGRSAPAWQYGFAAAALAAPRLGRAFDDDSTSPADSQEGSDSEEEESEEEVVPTPGKRARRGGLTRSTTAPDRWVVEDTRPDKDRNKTAAKRQQLREQAAQNRVERAQAAVAPVTALTRHTLEVRQLGARSWWHLCFTVTTAGLHPCCIIQQMVAPPLHMLPAGTAGPTPAPCQPTALPQPSLTARWAWAPTSWRTSTAAPASARTSAVSWTAGSPSCCRRATSGRCECPCMPEHTGHESVEWGVEEGGADVHGGGRRHRWHEVQAQALLCCTSPAPVPAFPAPWRHHSLTPAAPCCCPYPTEELHALLLRLHPGRRRQPGLARDAGLPLLRKVYSFLKQRGWLDAGWRVVELSIVAGYGNTKPYHQDIKFGSLAMQRVGWGCYNLLHKQGVPRLSSFALPLLSGLLLRSSPPGKHALAALWVAPCLGSWHLQAAAAHARVCLSASPTHRCLRMPCPAARPGQRYAGRPAHAAGRWPGSRQPAHHELPAARPGSAAPDRWPGAV